MPKPKVDVTFGIVAKASIQPTWPTVLDASGPRGVATPHPVGPPKWRIEATVEAFSLADAMALLVAKSFDLMGPGDQERLAEHIRDFADQMPARL
jgi:hypothetical protein